MDTSKRILIVDDDANIRQVASFAVQKAGYQVVCGQDGRQALAMFRQEQPDLIVLDIKMPEMDGTDVCRVIRKESDIPIIFLSSMDDEIDRIVGLELGADDYLTKPFSPRELVARIKTVLRRTIISASQHKNGPTDTGARTLLEHGKLRLDSNCFKVFWDRDELTFTSTEFSILRAMLSFPGKVFSRAELVERIYNGETYISDRTVDSHIRHIRNKFKIIPAEPLETVHGIGYKLGDCH